MPVASLRLISEQLLRPVWIHVRDVGDCPFSVIDNLLRLSSASQLNEIERNSPHLTTHTNRLWKQLCVNDFIEVRKLVEDGNSPDDDDLGQDWKRRYYREEEKKRIKMKLVLEKLRGQYNQLDEKKQSRQVQSVDGLRFEKRRKLNSTSSATPRPKSLLQKARHNTKQIASIYAPKRRSIQEASSSSSNPRSTSVRAVEEAFPSSSTSSNQRQLQKAVPKAAPAPPIPTSTSRRLSVVSPPPAPRHPRSPPATPSAASSSSTALTRTGSLASPAARRPIIKTITRTTTTTKRSSLAPISTATLGSSPPPPPTPASAVAVPINSFKVPPLRPIAQIPLNRRPPPPPPPPPRLTSRTQQMVGKTEDDASRQSMTDGCRVGGNATRRLPPPPPPPPPPGSSAKPSTETCNTKKHVAAPHSHVPTGLFIPKKR
ncbi:hypothetical protein JCM3766R1_005430 [Sporobolomyces carnicolor]